MQPNLLILDDDRTFARSAGDQATHEGFSVHLAHTLREAREIVSATRMELMLLDIGLPDGSGMDLVGEIDLTRHGQIVIVTAQPTLESARRAVSSPVIEYLIKPLHGNQYSSLLQQALLRSGLCPSNLECSAIGGLSGRSAVMQTLFRAIQRIGPADASVLIAGESGTGKELVARALHESSGRKGPFVAINCGAVPAELLASQLFGHERGSFTGAHSRHQGVFEQAAHGTLFLDEITEMPLQLQVYLLRALETGSVTRVGGVDATATPVRVVAATNRDPLAAIASGRLREDLYYRLADIPLNLPPLRERGADVLILTQLFIERLNARCGAAKYLATGCEQLLLRHSWPGNVRELRSAVQRAYLMDPTDALQVRPIGPAQTTLNESEQSVLFNVGMSLAEVERKALLKTLAHCNNDKTAAARMLGVSVRTVHNQLARYAQERGESEGEIAA